MFQIVPTTLRSHHVVFTSYLLIIPLLLHFLQGKYVWPIDDLNKGRQEFWLENRNLGIKRSFRNFARKSFWIQIFGAPQTQSQVSARALHPPCRRQLVCATADFDRRAVDVMLFC